MSDELTPKQLMFCKAYLANGFNATQAAISAGYSENCAKEIGCENLTKPLVKEFIVKRMQEIENKFDITFENKLRKLWKLVEAAEPQENERLNPNIGISAIAELNKMQGHYQDKKEVDEKLDDMKEKLNQLIERNKKDY